MTTPLVHQHQPQKLLIPLTQQYIPQQVIQGQQQSSLSSLTQKLHLQQQQPTTTLPASSELNNGSSHHFDRSSDSTCNFATQLALNNNNNNATANIGPYGHRYQQQQQQSSSLSSDIVGISWLPEISIAPPQAPVGNGIRNSGGGVSAIAAATSNATLSSTTKAPDAWCLGVLSNGSIRAVCASAGTTNLVQTEIIGATPEEEIVSRVVPVQQPSTTADDKQQQQQHSTAAKAPPLFSARANALCSFNTPRGLVASINDISAASTQNQQQSNESNNNNNNNNSKGSNNNSKPQPRGRGTANPTAQQQQSSSNLLSSSSLTAGGLSTKIFSHQRNMMTVLCFRGGNLHALLLDCPDSYNQSSESTSTTTTTTSSSSNNNKDRRSSHHGSNHRAGGHRAEETTTTTTTTNNLLGVHGLKAVMNQSLGKHTGPPQDLFFSIDSCQIEHYQMENPNLPMNNSNNASSSPFHLHRHFVLVHCIGRSAVSKGLERISAVACFELERKGQDSLTVDLTNNNFLTAVTRVGWTVIGGSQFASLISKQQQQSSTTSNPDAAAASGNNGETTADNNNKNAAPSSADDFFAKCSSLISLSIIGHSFVDETSSAGDENNSSNNGSSSKPSSPTSNSNTGKTSVSSSSLLSPHLMIALAHTGTPAVVRIGAIKLPAQQSSFSRGEFFVSGQNLVVNSKQSIFRLRTLSISKQTVLLAVLTNDNIVQVFCSAFRDVVVKGGVNKQSTQSASTSVRRQRDGAEVVTSNEEEGNQYELNTLSSSSSSSSFSTSTSSASALCWPLFTPRQKCPFPPVFTTFVCAINPPGATVNNPVDDLALVPSVSSSSNQKSSLVNVSLMAQLSSGLLQVFSLYENSNNINNTNNNTRGIQQQQELAKLEKSEAVSVLFPRGADVSAVAKCSASGPCVPTGSDGSVRSCVLAQVFGSHLIVLKPKKALKF